MIRVCLWRQRLVERIVSQRNGVFKFCICPMKLGQVRLLRGTCEFCVPYLHLSGADIISRPFSVLASLGRRSLKMTSRSLLLQASGFLKLSPTRDLLCWRPKDDIELCSRLPLRMQKEDGADFFLRICVLFPFLVRLFL
jgi:hypothetical protein